MARSMRLFFLLAYLEVVHARQECEADVCSASKISTSSGSVMLQTQSKKTSGSDLMSDDVDDEALFRLDDVDASHVSKASADCVPPGMQVAHVSGGGRSFQMVVLGQNDIVSKTLLQSGSWEVGSPSDMASKAGTLLPNNATLLDIGANIGFYTLLFAAHGHRVLAVEPMTRNRAALMGSLCLNPQFKELVHVVPAALVSPEEMVNTRCQIRSTNYDVNIGNGFLRCGDAAKAKPCLDTDANCENVPVKTLDMLLSQRLIDKVDVVKMDVEAHECQVLKGGESLFATYRPHILQVETAWGNGHQCVQDEAHKYNYRTVSDGMNTEMVEGSRIIHSFLQK